ncbi:MAG: TetR/AcrR family transcriptional regulator [Chloroflexi bacterium]|nr:TetR/AcrR family transcriptional regulator [Chloroflexota bacterium]
MATRNTKEILLRAAIDLFYRKGYAETSIRDIGAKADMSNSLVYHYFKNKEEVLFEIVSTASQDLLQSLQEIEGRVDDPWECLRQMLVVHLGVFGLQRKKEIKILVEELNFLRGKRREAVRQQQREIYDLYMNKLNLLAVTGRMNDVDLTVLNFSIFGIINWFYRWYREGGRLSSQEVADNILKILFDGIARPEPFPALRGDIRE